MAKARKKTTSRPAAPAAAPDLSHIAEDLRPLAVAVDTLTPDPHNARRHGEQNHAAIMVSLRQNGQLKPISVDADGVVLAGNGTLAAAKALGWTHIARVRCNLTGAAARRWAIQDNRTAELAEWDLDELQRQVDEIEATLGDTTLADLAFTDEQLDALANGRFDEAHGFAPKPEKKDPPAGEQEYPSVFKIILTCKDEAHQAELIREFEKRGYEFTAPNVT